MANSRLLASSGMVGLEFLLHKSGDNKISKSGCRFLGKASWRKLSKIQLNTHWITQIIIRSVTRVADFYMIVLGPKSKNCSWVFNLGISPNQYEWSRGAILIKSNWAIKTLHIMAGNISLMKKSKMLKINIFLNNA